MSGRRDTFPSHHSSSPRVDGSKRAAGFELARGSSKRNFAKFAANSRS
jgi:hypothetical protein